MTNAVICFVFSILFLLAAKLGIHKRQYNRATVCIISAVILSCCGCMLYDMEKWHQYYMNR